MPERSTLSPTVVAAKGSGLNRALARNIEAMETRRRRVESDASLQDKIAKAVTAFTGNLAFVCVHLAILALWVGVNSGLISALPRFDPTFVILATTASVEAIFLSSFVLISQNRAAKAADRRADLDLQINLLTEHEVTRMVALTRAIARKLDVPEAEDAELEELERDVAPEAVLDTLGEVKP